MDFFQTFLPVLTAGVGICIGWLMCKRTGMPKSISIPNVYNKSEAKLVLLVRQDLGMTKGKIAAQCSHATLGCYKQAEKICPEILKRWEWNGQPKIVLKAQSLDVLLECEKAADKLNINNCLIHDAGRTQIAAGSATVLGIGPAPADLIDKVSGHLKLL
ncbi:unnamed protein product [Dibothriocephalus latus]|uniref:peptidyl-tRNA hydrolase n=1 Tax=Dibothriocephalus latus TaxID=60516 RepID=A0A3P7Q0U3_DIBLA|nr:unnamed protein product [Dibothriocephalus latus]